MLICAHAGQIPLPDESVQCVVTSPPYWGLRKYAGEQELIWGGGPLCQHTWEVTRRPGISGGLRGVKADYEPHRFVPPSEHAFCDMCGAWRGAFGLEPTIEMYVAHTVEILREVRRVLRKDGVCWWNLGDSYNGQKRGNTEVNKYAPEVRSDFVKPLQSNGLKPKDLCLIPSRVALAAQADGWWVRSMIVWAKPNPMPESVQDRPTDAYEHIIMLTKAERYYWDADAVRENLKESSIERLMQDVDAQEGWNRVPGKTNGNMKAVARGGWNGSKFTDQRDKDTKPNLGTGPRNEVPGRNIRNVWTFPRQPYSGAHFATFPEEIPRRCIKAASKPGDLILDPFGGSGTTGRVAIELQRWPILLDLAYAHDYAPLAKERTSKVQLEAFV